MSKFSSYDDLPLDVAYELERLEHELEEGDITQKGYDKKKSNILAPYQLSEKAAPEKVAPEIDLGPEPSAADVVDFLDFLPSPTHSPVDKKGSQLMEQHINSPSTGRPPPLPFRPLLNSQSQPQFRPPPPPPRPFDPRMGYPRPVHNYPMRPPPSMNGFRPPPAPMYNRPYGPYRPPMNGQSHHSRSASIESSTGSQFGVRQSMESAPDWGKFEKNYKYVSVTHFTNIVLQKIDQLLAEKRPSCPRQAECDTLIQQAAVPYQA